MMDCNYCLAKSHCIAACEQGSMMCTMNRLKYGGTKDEELKRKEKATLKSDDNSVFEAITASPEVLAKELSRVFCRSHGESEILKWLNEDRGNTND